jgi:FMN phosphatase YigB (HAD superfamily)
LKADAEAAMEKLAGLKKQKVVCVTNSFKEEKESKL